MDWGDPESASTVYSFLYYTMPMLCMRTHSHAKSYLAHLMVTDDKLMLDMTDGRHHCIDRLNTSHHRLVYQATGKNYGLFQRSITMLSGFNGAFAVNR
jgi:hypothetical protein